MNFSEILGQSYAKKVLKNSLKTGRISHAYLFFGPEGVGKELTARIFAQALLCEKRGNSDPCNRCISCIKVCSNTHPDFKIIEPEERGLTIKIDQIREIQKDIFYRPLQSNLKIYILKEVEKMNIEASNCFLKILEEPPPYGIFILITTNLLQISETIVSRCQLIRFELLKKEDVVKLLKDKLRELPQKEIELISNLCCGEAGIALEKNRVLSLTRDRILEFLTSLSPVELFNAIKVAEQTRNFLKETNDNERKKLIEVIDTIIFIFRDLIVLKETGNPDFLINKDRMEILNTLIANYSLENLIKIIEFLKEVKGDVKKNVNIGLLLEFLFLKISKLAEGGEINYGTGCSHL